MITANKEASKNHGIPKKVKSVQRHSFLASHVDICSRMPCTVPQKNGPQISTPPFGTNNKKAKVKNHPNTEIFLEKI